MNILALETSTNSCSICVSNGEQFFMWEEVVGNQHAKLLLPQIDLLLSQAQISLSQLNLLAFGQGPGSFTGLRIGASVIQGLSFAHKIKVAPVSSLQALAWQAYKKYSTKNIVSLIDARMSEVYVGIYADTGKLLMPESVINPAALDADLSNLLFIGTGAKEYEAILREKFPAAQFALDILYPRAIEVCELAVAVIPVDGQDAMPEYIRNNVAFQSNK
jgi:tRNA threonylcarbamoyladenosine biosynthesis protein TsaB